MERIKVLLIEDNILHQKIIKTLFDADNSFELKIYSDVNDIINIISSFNPDVILLDIKLPFKSGIDLFNEIKSNEKLKKIKIVALTSYAMKNDRERFLAMGFDGYIPKPIDTRNFISQLKEIIK
jgi:CheY-like chemotaxis protein